jgi:hypothetical protein
MAFVVLQPHSRTNTSDKYRVVDHEAWVAFINGSAMVVPFAGQFDTYDEAKELRNRLNWTTRSVL